MPLNEKEAIREYINDDVYASTDLSVSIPKYKFPSKSTLLATFTRSSMTS